MLHLIKTDKVLKARMNFLTYNGTPNKIHVVNMISHTNHAELNYKVVKRYYQILSCLFCLGFWVLLKDHVRKPTQKYICMGSIIEHMQNFKKLNFY